MVVAESDDLRQFIREIAVRHERIWRDQAKAIREQLAELRALREESRRHWDENRREWEANRKQWEEAREESSAQRQALLHILDRLQNGGAAA